MNFHCDPPTDHVLTAGLGALQQHCYDPTVRETWRANWTHSFTDIGVYICGFFIVYLATGKMRQHCNVICLLNLVFKYFLRNSCRRWMFSSLFLYSISAQCSNTTTSVISLKFYKYHLLGFLTLFLFFVSSSRFPSLHCPLHDHWYSEK